MTATTNRPPLNMYLPDWDGRDVDEAFAEGWGLVKTWNPKPAPSRGSHVFTAESKFSVISSIDDNTDDQVMNVRVRRGDTRVRAKALALMVASAIAPQTSKT